MSEEFKCIGREIDDHNSPWRRASRRWRGVSLLFMPEKASLTRFFFFSCISRTYIAEKLSAYDPSLGCTSYLGLNGVLRNQLIHTNRLRLA